METVRGSEGGIQLSVWKTCVASVKGARWGVILVMNNASASGNLKIGPLVVWPGKCSF
jgi:hypothetical protein